ncbi:MAG: peptide-binding protein [Nitrospirae bacterium]|nr:peptide-binding protein [Nitrospirota bacterium]
MSHDIKKSSFPLHLASCILYRNILSLRPLTLYAFALITFALLFAACVKEPPVKKTQSLTTGFLADAKRLLPVLASDSASGEISGLIFNGLTKYDKDIKITGDLADSWTISPDGLIITFNLKKGVKWQDGVEFTADDVLFTYQKVTDPKVATPYSSNYGPVKKVEALDKYTVRVTYSEPYAPALESWGMGIIPRHLLQGKDINTDEFNRNPVGTGPYKLKGWVTGQKIVLDANDNYFEGRPKIDQYTAKITTDQSAMFLELQAGIIDFMSLTPTQFKVQSEKTLIKKFFQKFNYPAFSYTYLGYNLLDPRFADKKVRQALSHAINKEAIINGVLFGYGTPCTGPFPPESWAYNPKVKTFDYNPELAKALLKESGWIAGKSGFLEKDNQPFSFTILVNQGNDVRLKSAQIIQQDFKKVGIDVKISVLEWQTMLHEFIDKKKFEAVILGWALSRDPDMYDIWHSAKTKEGEFNFISYKNPEVDRLLLEGRRTFDIEARKKIYFKIHEMLAEDQPYTFLYVPDALPILHKRFKGVQKTALGIAHDWHLNWYVPKNKAEWYK